MAEGFIKLARELLEKPMIQNSKLLQIWVWCLLKASHAKHDEMVGLQKVPLIPGQFVTGRYAGAKEIKMNPSTFWKYLQWLKANKSLDIKSNSKFSLVTIVNWELYQVELFKSDSKNNTKMTAKEQQNDTNKNGKNGKNEKTSIPYSEIQKAYNEICVSLPKIKSMTSKRKSHVNARLDSLGNDVDKLINVFYLVEENDFLTNRQKKNRNDWRADFDWIINETNFAKIIEGKYKNKNITSETKVHMLD
jgi:hypothetical protein